MQIVAFEQLKSKKVGISLKQETPTTLLIIDLPHFLHLYYPHQQPRKAQTKRTTSLPQNKQTMQKAQRYIKDICHYLLYPKYKLSNRVLSWLPRKTQYKKHRKDKFYL